MKNLKNLNRKDLKEITGGWDSGYCARLCRTNNPNHPNWNRCHCDIVIIGSSK